MNTLSQAWTHKFLTSLAEEFKASARESHKKNWLYSTCKDLAVADALDHLASKLNSDTVTVMDLERLNKILDQS